MLGYWDKSTRNHASFHSLIISWDSYCVLFTSAISAHVTKSWRWVSSMWVTYQFVSESYLWHIYSSFSWFAVVLLKGFESGNKVQAFDSVLGQWLNGTVVEVDGGKVQIHWAGYNKFFDVRLDASEVRKPEDERPLDTRRPVLKSNFPKRQHPKHLQKDDLVRVFETNQVWSEAQTVAKNDCFKGEVRRFVFRRFIYL